MSVEQQRGEHKMGDVEGHGKHKGHRKTIEQQTTVIAQFWGNEQDRRQGNHQPPHQVEDDNAIGCFSTHLSHVYPPLSSLKNNDFINVFKCHQ